jgi:hypothetical protein
MNRAVVKDLQKLFEEDDDECQGVYSSISSRIRHLSILVQILVFVFLNFVCDKSLSKTMRVYVGRINGVRLCK